MDITVERLTTALIKVTIPRKHGQLCPVWVTRIIPKKKGMEPTAQPDAVCDCFVSQQAPILAAQALEWLEAN